MLGLIPRSPECVVLSQTENKDGRRDRPLPEVSIATWWLAAVLVKDPACPMLVDGNYVIN